MVKTIQWVSVGRGKIGTLFDKRQLFAWVGAWIARKICRLLMWVLLTCPLFGDGLAGESERADRLRVMTYNIHHAEGIDGRLDVKRIVDLICRHGADIVALQEVDRGTERVGQRDLLAELSEATGLHKAFAKTLDYQGGDYGIGILSRFRILEERETFFEREWLGVRDDYWSFLPFTPIVISDPCDESNK